ncbi:MAG TPA: flagellar basal-body rod protein FlgF [Rhodothermales bacterium]|nr:flagellar basal-body rod protein FlgF [Rhodothermales bacterium]
MLQRLRTAAASMAEMTRRQERTANNLANVDTSGYRRERTFANVLREQIDAEGAPRTVRTTGGWADLNPGELQATGNPLDVALERGGFFVVAGPDGAERYTRAGSFGLDATGTLRTLDGDAVMGEEGPLTLPPGSAVTVSAEGRIAVDGQPVGTLRVVTFADPATLRRAGDTTFTSTAPPTPVDDPGVRQGFVEGSNVDAVREMADMITHFRLFEAQQKMVQSTDELLGAVTRDLGRF